MEEKDDLKFRYCKMMNTIQTDKEKFTSKVLNSGREKKARKFLQRRGIFLVPGVCALAILVILVSTYLPQKNNFTIYAYASDGTEETIGKKAFQLQNEFTPEFAEYAGDKTNVSSATGSSKMTFRCDGSDISKITYTILGEQEFHHRGKLKVPQVYFAEEISLTLQQYYDYRFDEELYPNLCYLFKPDGEDEYTGSNYLGTSYTVDYDTQDEKEYSIQYSMFQNEEKEWTTDDITIQVIAEFDDGSKAVKKLLIKPVSTSSNEEHGLLELEVSEK